MDINKLAKLQGSDFVKEVYGEILFREPDDEGLKSYSDCLKQGTSRAEVLLNINGSEEAKSKKAIPNDELILLLKDSILAKELPENKNKTRFQMLKYKVKRKIFSFIASQIKEYLKKETSENVLGNNQEINDSIEKEKYRKEMPNDAYKTYVRLRGDSF